MPEAFTDAKRPRCPLSAGDLEHFGAMGAIVWKALDCEQSARPTATLTSALSNKKQRSIKPPVCQVCGVPARKPTEEHAYPKWLLRYGRQRLRQAPPPALSLSPDWEQGAKVVLKPVCRGCQHRMNILFEQPARPLLMGMLEGSMELRENDRKILAGWFLKTSAVLGLARDNKSSGSKLERGGRSRLENALRSLLDHNGTPPVNVCVRVACRSPLVMPNRRPLAPPDPLLLAAGAEGMTFVTAFLSIVSDIAVVYDRLALGRWLQIASDSRFVRIWPVVDAGSCRWPPLVPIAFTDASRLAAERGMRANVLIGVRSK